MEPFDVLFSLTVYRDGKVRITSANGNRATHHIAATLRDIALAVEAGVLVLSEYDEDEWPWPV